MTDIDGMALLTLMFACAFFVAFLKCLNLETQRDGLKRERDSLRRELMQAEIHLEKTQKILNKVYQESLLTSDHTMKPVSEFSDDEKVYVYTHIKLQKILNKFYQESLLTSDHNGETK